MYTLRYPSARRVRRHGQESDRFLAPIEATLDDRRAEEGAPRGHQRRAAERSRRRGRAALRSAGGVAGRHARIHVWADDHWIGKQVCVNEETISIWDQLRAADPSRAWAESKAIDAQLSELALPLAQQCVIRLGAPGPRRLSEDAGAGRLRASRRSAVRR